MENPAVKTTRPSSNISEILSRFSKACKLRSFDVFPSESTDVRPDSNDPCEETKDKLGGTEICAENYKPSKKNRTFCGDDEISKLFDIVSGLKLAYVQFQKAHLPYDTEKIIAADNLVVSQFEELCRIKRQCKKTKLITKAKLDSSRLDRLKEEIDVKERNLEKLKAQVKSKDCEFQFLLEELHCLIAMSNKLDEKLNQNSLEIKKIDMWRFPNISSLESVFQAASKSIHDFAKPLIVLMRASGWDLDKAAGSIVGEVMYAKKSDKKYPFESYIARRMFQDTNLEPCNIYDLTRFDDPLDALMAFPDSGFSKFCRQKYLLVVHPSMEASFFGNLDQRGLVLLGKHPRTIFYRIFAKMAKWVWILETIAASLDKKAKIFVVRRGTRFSDVYMESVEQLLLGEGQADLTVQFITMPGFKIGDSTIRSRVYLSEMK
ncbi:PREDICTED: uncharacterized protein LOC104815821 [Tarenaya hassleriana]|uniref:uncharacterized protein LOC104815821 n=1 Tax=Tarenaya hassleriana TaxID=28532 RepID=UPI00053C1FFB|nr:PREDICTED: uncharacterized protein LOC104815821 [Tarenaya hassleriana]XP_010542679.1 PREDICTED: uncharacterized protein LOC104815821 [Tarenaya hassleriana]XP_019058358.1 PREDICTED: uncharacterized protein LOC104815821 [Tarenaya hassleriana]XP_019058359.1 PREDICTED: uncharacterized protein LOC104815821 [Tarenaya hassleriana]